MHHPLAALPDRPATCRQLGELAELCRDGGHDLIYDAGSGALFPFARKEGLTIWHRGKLDQGDDVETITKETLRCRKIVTSLLDFARSNPSLLLGLSNLGDVSTANMQAGGEKAPNGHSTGRCCA